MNTALLYGANFVVYRHNIGAATPTKLYSPIRQAPGGRETESKNSHKKVKLQFMLNSKNILKDIFE